MNKMYCRICLERTDSGSGTDLFEATNSVEILQKISFCTEVSLCKSDILSNKICRKCVFRIEESNILKRECLFSEKLLKTLHEGGTIFKEFCQSNLSSKQLKFLKEDSILNNYIRKDESHHEVIIEFEGEKTVKLEQEFEQANNDSGNEYFNDKSIQNIESDLVNIENNYLEHEDIKKRRKHTGINKKKFRSYKSQKTEIPSIISCRGAIELTERNEIDNSVEHSFVCNECGHVAASKGALSRHINDHKRAKCQCPLCELTFPSQKVLNTHMEGTHGKIKAFPCKICGKKYVSLRKANRHRVTIHGEYQQRKYLERRLERGISVRCGQCDIKFDSNPQYRRHYQAVHKGKKKTHVCDICGQEFTVARCKDHRLRHFPPAHPCTHCEKKFYTEQELRAHHQIVHLGISKYACGECGRLEASATALERHRLSQHSTARAFDCPRCRKAFLTRDTYRRHIECHYNRHRTFTCNICGEKNKVRARLDRHMLKVHSLETRGVKSCEYITATGTTLTAAEKEEITELVRKKYKQVQELKKTGVVKGNSKLELENKVS